MQLKANDSVVIETLPGEYINGYVVRNISTDQYLFYETCSIEESEKYPNFRLDWSSEQKAVRSSPHQAHILWEEYKHYQEIKKEKSMNLTPTEFHIENQIYVIKSEDKWVVINKQDDTYLARQLGSHKETNHSILRFESKFRAMSNTPELALEEYQIYLKQQNPPTKKVRYNGVDLDFPGWVNYTAVSSSGEAWIFESDPSSSVNPFITSLISPNRSMMLSKLIRENDLLSDRKWKKTIKAL